MCIRDRYAAAATPSIQIQPLPGLAAIPAPPEDAPTFEANARAKALYYAAHAPGLLVLADDSGLEVLALDNAPGVRSARYAEDQAFPTAPASTELSLIHILCPRTSTRANPRHRRNLLPYTRAGTGISPHSPLSLAHIQGPWIDIAEINGGESSLERSGKFHSPDAQWFPRCLSLIHI